MIRVILVFTFWPITQVLMKIFQFCKNQWIATLLANLPGPLPIIRVMKTTELQVSVFGGIQNSYYVHINVHFNSFNYFISKKLFQQSPSNLQVLLVWYIETIPNFFASIQNTDPE
jgi:hypothetical protein